MCKATGYSHDAPVSQPFLNFVFNWKYAEKDGVSGGSNEAPASSATVNLQLNAGQLVRIENVGSTLIYSTHAEGFVQSWFTGHLLYAL